MKVKRISALLLALLLFSVSCSTTTSEDGGSDIAENPSDVGTAPELTTETEAPQEDRTQYDPHLDAVDYGGAAFTVLYNYGNDLEPNKDFTCEELNGEIVNDAKYNRNIALCDKYNTVLICDEIQCGYGRSGKFFAHQHLGVRPDLITVAKGICNGFPMSAVLISPKFTPVYGQLGTTFGGNHLGCAGAIAVLDVIEQEHLVENAAKVGTYLIDTLKAEQAAGNLPHVVDVRGQGLMIGIELDIPYKEPRTRLIKEQHCFTGCSGTNVIRLLPPLCLSMDEAKEFIEKFKKVL